MFDMNMVGKRVKARRLELRMSKETLAKKSCISEYTVRNIERGLNFPRIDTMYLVAEILGVSIDWLCGRVEAIYPTVQATKEE